MLEESLLAGSVRYRPGRRRSGRGSSRGSWRCWSLCLRWRRCPRRSRLVRRGARRRWALWCIWCLRLLQDLRSWRRGSLALGLRLCLVGCRLAVCCGFKRRLECPSLSTCWALLLLRRLGCLVWCSSLCRGCFLGLGLLLCLSCSITAASLTLRPTATVGCRSRPHAEITLEH